MDIYSKPPLSVYLRHYSKPSLDEYLAHHGILGQKWGVRNGPPYPLGEKDHSASEKKAGWRKSLDKGGKNADNKSKNDADSAKKKGLTDEQKRVIKIGAGIAVGLLAVYGTYKLADSGELHRLAEKGKAFVNGSPPTWRKNPELARSDMTSQEIFDTVVPRINPLGPWRLGRSRNCRRCTFAYEIARRGFEVKATSTLSGTGQNFGGLYNATHEHIVKGGTIRQILHAAIAGDDFSDFAFQAVANENRLAGTPIKLVKNSFAKSIFSALAELPNGSRGELSMRFTKGCGHSMAWEIVNGKPVIFDCQRLKMFDSVESFIDLADELDAVSFTRLDNVDLNYDFLLRWVENLF